MSESETDTKVTIQSMDGVNFVVNLKAAKMSKTVATLLENFDGYDNENEGPGNGKDVIPATAVNGATLKLVIDWMKYHQDDIPISFADDLSQMRYQSLSTWDEDFFGRCSKEQIYELLLAANYLDIQDMTVMLCQKVTSMTLGKSSEDIRQMFGLPNNICHHMDEFIQRENIWYEKKS